MKVYCVYDNNRPAKFPEVGVPPSWSNNKFTTFEEALAYAWRWLDCEVVLKVDVPWDYSGYGDMIEIRGESTKEDKMKLWFKVGDKLPEDGEVVLACVREYSDFAKCDMDDFHIAFQYEGEWWVPSENGRSIKPAFWMPIPETPE